MAQSPQGLSFTSHLLHRIATLILTAGLLILSFHASEYGYSRENTSVPNIVLILADDLGYGDVGCYGAKDVVTPAIDSIAAAGMRFERFYANCTVCSPTRAALLTGRYPEMVGVPGVIRTLADQNYGYLHEQAVLLPQLLKKQGYHSALIGKWHLGLEAPNTPLDRGFDFFHGFLGDMMDDYVTHLRHDINYLRRDRETIEPKGHATELFTAWANEYLRERAKAGEPFFLYLAYNAPHAPLQPPDVWRDRVLERDPKIDPKRAKLIGLIEHMDAGVREVLKTLKETGLDSNTIVAFTSDNGGALHMGASNGPWRGGKTELYEGGLRVPAIVAWPGHIAPGSGTQRLALTMDLFPTLCAAAGVEIPHPIDGLSFLPTLLGEKQPPPMRDMFWTYREGSTRMMGQAALAVRRGHWKIVHNHTNDHFELFNVQSDPSEKTNLRTAHGDKFNELAEALKRHVIRSGAVPWQQPDSAHATEPERDADSR